VSTPTGKPPKGGLALMVFWQHEDGEATLSPLLLYPDRRPLIGVALVEGSKVKAGHLYAWDSVKDEWVQVRVEVET
jgi:hypothetical protein